jgi:beta-phosphoglucomutase-like phosphatase (HAD superfamily)
MTLPLRAVLFDMDGTLLDTAPDMVGALNALRREEGLAPLPYEVVRSGVSHGVARLVKMGFPGVEGESFAALQKRFLDIYSGALSQGTQLFAGMEQVLGTLAGRRLKSGIVTNKPALCRLRTRRGCRPWSQTTVTCRPMKILPRGAATAIWNRPWIYWAGSMPAAAHE